MINNNNYWDQTNFSPGGLYSSTYPPLNSLMIAYSIKLFGESEFSVRLFVSICSIIFLFVFYRISTRFISPIYSIISCILLSSTIIWNTYSRQAMADIPLLTFIILSFFALIKILETENKFQLFFWSIGLILFISSGLMLKIVKSFLPVLFVIIFIFNCNDKKKKILVVLSCVISLIIAFPWYFYMSKTYGSNFFNALFPPHILSNVESNAKSLSILYYFNQLIATSPLTIIVFIAIVLITINYKTIRDYIKNIDNKFVLLSTLIWFILTFFSFTFSVTKMPNYSLYIIPPALLLSIYIFENHKVLFNNNRKILFLFSIIYFTTYWSLSPNLRNGIKEIMKFNFDLESLIYISFIIIVLLYLILNKKVSKINIDENIKIKLLITISVVLLFRVFLINYIDKGNINGSGYFAGKFIKDNSLVNFIYVYHEHNKADSLNPQLGWYTKGQLYGWIKNRTYTPIPIDENKFDVLSIKKTDSLPYFYLIYAISHNNKLAKETIEEISSTREILHITKDYIIFSKKKKVRKEVYI